MPKNTQNKARLPKMPKSSGRHGKARLLKRFRSFVLGIKPTDRIALLYHTDPDGICSGVITAKAIERIAGNKILLPLIQGHSEIAISHGTIQKLKRAGINKFIAVDQAVDDKPGQIRKIEKFASILILDHHMLKADLNSGKTLMIKPQFISEIEPSRYCASKLAYDLFSEFTELSDLSWICAVGIIGDYGYSQWKQFVDNAAKKHNLKKGKDIWHSELADIMELINGVEAADVSKIPKVFRLFYSARSPKAVLKSGLGVYRKKLDKELSYWMEKTLKEAERDKKLHLLFYTIKPRADIKSKFVNTLSRKFPKTTVVIIQDSGKPMLRVSARRQDFRVKCNELMQASLKGLKNASGGGHIPAAAGHFQRKDLGRFRQNLESYLAKGFCGRTYE